MRRMAGWAGAVWLALAGAAVSQEDVVFSFHHVDACFATGGWTECIGAAAERCMEDTPLGHATPVVNACLDLEREWWDNALNIAYRELIELERAADNELAEFHDHRPSGVTMLRDMQRAWMAYRDATCGYEEFQWYGGTGATGAYLGCNLRLTGQQVLFLWSMMASG